jgi:hypothetical protein
VLHTSSVNHVKTHWWLLGYMLLAAILGGGSEIGGLHPSLFLAALVVTLPVGAFLPMALFLCLAFLSIAFSVVGFGHASVPTGLAALVLAVAFGAGAFANAMLFRGLLSATRPCRARLWAAVSAKA